MSQANPESSSSTLRVALVQAAASLDARENRERLSELMPDRQDLVVWPEAFARDFGEPGSDLSGAAEPLHGPFATEVARLAVERHTAVVAGMFEPAPDASRPFNTLIAHDASGRQLASYRKIHLYDSFGYRESDALTAGEWEPVVVEIAGWQVGLMTCYDLRFPELARELVRRGAEVLVLPSAWVAGEGKVHHWKTLATARAIENVCFVVACDQPGPRYAGHSLVVGPLGETLAEADTEPAVLQAVLSRDQLTRARTVNPSLSNTRR